MYLDELCTLFNILGVLALIGLVALGYWGFQLFVWCLNHIHIIS
jgi:hypothetical protein